MTKPPNIYVVDDDASIRFVLERALTRAGFAVRVFEGGEAALAAVAHARPDALITDIRMPDMDGIELLERLKQAAPDLPVIVITAHSDLRNAVAAFQGGAFEYLPKPFDVDEAVKLVNRALEQRATTVSGGQAPARPAELLGESRAFQEVFRAIGRLSRSNVTVLITGETGTGKELVARAVHDHSLRARGPFIAINIAAVPRELLESELFGHEKGAFTGAVQSRMGRFEQARGGTLFLDEIGDMPIELQTRLLRVLQDGRYYRVGGHDQIESDVRIVAATNQDLEMRVRDDRFREDLYHRLNVIRLHLPALRERVEDIPLLARHFLARAGRELDIEVKHYDPETLAHLKILPWPGNVRQLDNACRWLAVMAPGNRVRVEDLPPELRSSEATVGADDWREALRHLADSLLARGDNGVANHLYPEFERVLLKAALNATGHHKQEAARRLGWGRNTLTRKLKELGMGESE